MFSFKIVSLFNGLCLYIRYLIFFKAIQRGFQCNLHGSGEWSRLCIRKIASQVQGNQPPAGGFCTREQRGCLGGRVATTRGQPFFSLTHSLLIPVRPNLVWDGKTPIQFLFSQSLLQPRMATFFSSAQWDMNRCPLEKFWDRCHCPGPFSFFMPWKWSWRLDWQLFGRCFHPKPHSLCFLHGDFRAPNFCVCGVDTVVPWCFLPFLCFYFLSPMLRFTQDLGCTHVPKPSAWTRIPTTCANAISPEYKALPL